MRVKFRGYASPVVKCVEPFYQPDIFTVGKVYDVILPGHPDYPRGFPFSNPGLEHDIPNTPQNMYEQVEEEGELEYRNALIRGDDDVIKWVEFIFFDLVED